LYITKKKEKKSEDETTANMPRVGGVDQNDCVCVRVYLNVCACVDDLVYTVCVVLMLNKA